MLTEAIKVVCEAEEEARREKTLAQRNGRETIEEADLEGKKAVARTIARAESEIAHLIRSADQKATEQAKELASKTANRQATLRARAERRLENAAQLIFERIVNV